MDLTGQNLGKYKIIKKIGSGGMGNIYLAQDTVLDRDVALKLLAPGIAADTSFVERFRLEARALARLDHPAIVRVFDADWLDNQLYLVMAFIDGGSLDDLIRAEGALPPELALRILTQVADGLDFAHQQGLIHRDIKPANILLDKKGQAQITDFGLVKDADISLTAADQRLGTPAYMAPEQIQGQDLGPEADVYALGVVAYEAFTGQKPFTGTISAVFEGHLLRAPAPLSSINPSIPLTLQSAVLKALEKNPDDRYSSATEFVGALRTALEAGDEPAGSDIQATIAFKPGPRLQEQPSGQVSSGQAASPPSGSRTAAPSGQHASRPPQKKKSGAGFKIGAFGIGTIAVVGVLCLCAALTGLYLIGASQEDPVTAPITSTPEIAESIPTPTTAPVVLYEYNFDTQDTDSFVPEQSDEGRTSFYNNGFRVQVNELDWVYWGLAEQSFMDLTIEVQVTKIDGNDENDMGIICRYIDADNFYYLYITANGLYGIDRWKNGDYQRLTGSPASPDTAINTGNAANLLRADCSGDTLRLSANGVFLTEITGADQMSGDVGLAAASTYAGGIDVVFDNLVVTEPQP